MRTCPRDDDKTRHHFWHQTFDVDCLKPLTNLLLHFTDCPWFGGVNKLLQVAPNVKVKRGKVGNLAGQSTGPRRLITSQESTCSFESFLNSPAGLTSSEIRWRQMLQLLCSFPYTPIEGYQNQAFDGARFRLQTNFHASGWSIHIAAPAGYESRTVTATNFCNTPALLNHMVVLTAGRSCNAAILTWSLNEYSQI